MVGGRREIVVSVIFQFAFFFSIFDIYFRSPIVHGITPVEPNGIAPANRVVLVVADGLRADRLFEDRARAPFLHSILRDRGSWGVSHTRVPTESRPGHVAVIGGLYEDVSAVTRGWQHNPVEFDTVFNQSSFTFAYGSPDIVPMFTEKLRHAQSFFYSSDKEDFASKDATLLDAWVFARLNETFEAAKIDPQLSSTLHQRGVVFFLHLLGLDTQGHAYRPHAKEYLNNIRYVDEQLRIASDQIESFFGDRKTAFVFTSDHGMSDRGNHGDGEAANTQTPLIAWGAGIAGPNETRVPVSVYSDEARFPSPGSWGVRDDTRKDVDQADIAPLMSTLIGASIPVNSVGKIPLNYLHGDHRQKVSTLVQNVRQLYGQFRRKEQVMSSSKTFFTPFIPLFFGQNLVQRIESLLEKNSITEAGIACAAMIDSIMEGLHYLQTYDWMFLMACVVLGYASHGLWLLVGITRHYSKFSFLVRRPSREDRFLGYLVPIVIFGPILAFAYSQTAPTVYYIYVLFPAYFVHTVAQAMPRVLEELVAEGCSDCRQTGRILLLMLNVLVILEITVLGYSRREVFFVCAFLLGVRSIGKQWLNLCWLAVMGVLGAFTLLPIDMPFRMDLVAAGAAIFVAVGACVVVRANSFRVRLQSRMVVVSLVVLLMLSVTIVYDTTSRLASKSGVPSANLIGAWLILVVAFAIPIIYAPSNWAERLLVVSLALASPIVLLSTNYEVLFQATLSAALSSWLLMVRAAQSRRTSQSDLLELADVEIALTFILFIHIAFFGLGNIASVSSFEISSAFRFVTTFSPFTMGALLMFKTMIPIILVACFFRAVAQVRGISFGALHLMIVLFCDILAVNFFFLVRDEGSWKDIGNSISQFAIQNAFNVFVPVLHGVAWLLVRNIVVTKPHAG